ncbi:serine O-acetyltransferase, partial [Acinetobacter baumannii]|uniref:hypothetical protein n=1 Tax=Acinetobacter baumannii TaxID=470 RepID=UPI0033482E7A
GRVVAKADAGLSEQRQHLAKKYGFDAYAVSADNPDPVANAIGSLLDHVHVLENKVSELCHSVNELGGNVCEQVPSVNINETDFREA